MPDPLLGRVGPQGGAKGVCFQSAITIRELSRVPASPISVPISSSLAGRGVAET